MRRTLFALLAACTSPPSAAPVTAHVTTPGWARSRAMAELPLDAERCYAIWLGGARVGTAREVERWSADGVTLTRTESMQFLRGAAAVSIETVIEITADRALAASRVRWSETSQASRRGDAVRDDDGWRVTGDDGTRRLPGSAIPAEIAPLVVRRDGRFEGRVFLPARGFVVGAGRIEPVAPGRLIAHLVLDAPGTAGAVSPGVPTAADATIDLGDDAMPVRVVDGEGVIATRITAVAAAAPFAPVDLIAATSIPIPGPRTGATPGPRAGATPGPRAGGSREAPSPRIALDGDLALPPVPGQAPDPRIALDGDLALPPVPGQAVLGSVPAASGLPGSHAWIELALSPRLPGGLPPGSPGPDRTREIARLVRRVDARIAPDLAADPASTRTAAAAISGDCTTFALAYAALAAERAIPTRLVTGFRVDGDRLVRHRWAASWTGRAWIAVDAAFGAVPAGGDLIGLAIHDTGDVGLIAGDAALTRLRAAAWR